jgi:hypothetical protein
MLFGGYDTEKYTGDLMALDIQPDALSGKVNTMTVAWTSLSITDSRGSTLLTSTNFAAPAVLDSGTSYTALPTAIFNNIVSYFGVVNDENYGNLVRCNVSSYKGTIDYGFGGFKGPVISVKYAEVVIPIYDQDGTQPTFIDGSYACAFGIFPVSSGEQILFGDTFLRSAYVIYDLENKQIGLAPTNFGSTESNVIEIGKGGGIGASSAASSVSVAQTGTVMAGPGMMGAVSATEASITAVPLPGSLGTVTASEARPTNGSGIGTVSSASTHTPQSAAVALPVADPALMVVVACSVAMTLLGGLVMDMA